MAYGGREAGIEAQESFQSSGVILARAVGGYKSNSHMCAGPSSNAHRIGIQWR